MNRYILDPGDAIRILPPQAGESAQIEIVCGRTMIFFDIAALESVCTAHGLCGGDAVRFVGADALLGAKHEVYVPSSRPEHAPLCEALKKYAPPAVFAPEMDYVRETCDHKGPHRV